MITATAAAEPTTNEFTIRTYANGFGRWCAYVTFNPPLSGTDDRAAHNMATQMPVARDAAREAIINELVLRERTTRETEDQARARITDSLPDLHLIAKEKDASGLIRSVTLGE
ncbi:hypothetical protein [Arthrobacter sp. ES1]|uniref:hypothetical protein n=1 Tax=Arthrobacter sp. ES1 TaxID=1897056 RepID=UPI001CFFEBA1|nr:hypothetical protein [Arthrobacter sp. ES1]MCB5280464.1 hypothetical protein [Arthrobacter sp. ES1]